jgi:very-short-patch-repair endonuclease
MRQFIVDDRYIVDLYVSKYKLIIEVDGGYHDNKEQKIKDEERELYLKSKGFEIIRFKNEEIRNNSSKVLKTLKEKIRELADLKLKKVHIICSEYYYQL